MKKSVFLALLLFAAAVGVGLVLWSAFCRGVQPVRVTAVELSTLHGSVSTDGRVEPVKLWELRAPISGPCRRIEAHQGDSMKVGQPIVAIDDSLLRSELASARAELAAAELDLRNVRRGPPPEELNQAEAECIRYRLGVENARKVLETDEWLLQRNAVPRFEVEQAQRDLARAQQSLDAAQTRLQDLKARYGEADQKRAAERVQAAAARISYLERAIGKSIIRTPIDGTLYSFGLKEGAYLNTGDLIGLFADLNRLRVRAFVDEPELGRVYPGAEVVVRWDAYPKISWKGTVAQVSSEVVARESRSVAEVLCTIEDQDHLLLPNVHVDVEIDTAPGARVPSLPRSTVFPGAGQGHFVWVIQDGRAVRRSVEMGRSTSTLIEVAGGLSLGDRVIVPGEVPLTEGMRVRVAGP